jgi:hypothetical protein
MGEHIDWLAWLADEYAQRLRLIAMPSDWDRDALRLGQISTAPVRECGRWLPGKPPEGCCRR